MSDSKMLVPPGVIPSAQDLFESVPKLRTKYGVYNRIQRRIEISQPKENRDHVFFEQVRVDWQQHRHYEERQPAQNKSTSYYGQGLGRFSFAFRICTVT